MKRVNPRGHVSQKSFEKNFKNSLRENIDVISSGTAVPDTFKSKRFEVFGSILLSMFSKKSLSFLLVVVMALNVFAFPVLASNDVAYIFKNRNVVDDNVVGVFEGLGLDVDLISENNIPSDLSEYRFVYLGDERYRNEDKIESIVDRYSTIVANYYLGPELGLTDRDGVSKLASSSPLSVKIGHRVVQVYTEARNRGIGIPLYFLGEDNKLGGLNTVAETYTGDHEDAGDVISYGEDICFFGIVESNFWTDDAVELFEGCVAHVGVTCENNGDCQDEPLGDPYCIGTQVYQNINKGTCQDGNTVQSTCVGTPNQVLLEVCSNSCQAGACVCLDKDNDGFDECVFGTDGDDGNNLDCNDNNANANPGLSEICGDNVDNNCDGNVDEHCPVDNDNDDFDNANPGTPGDDGFPIDCNDNNFLINPSANEICDFLDNNCNGVVDEGCSVDEDEDGYDNSDPGDPGDDGLPVDCNDNDDTVNPGAFEICDAKDNDCDGQIDESDGDCGSGEVCSLGTCTAIECNSDSECGNDGFFDGQFCGPDGVYQNYIDYTCNNGGTISSTCSEVVDARLVDSCSDSCSEGSCVSITCNNALDCNDGDLYTEDSCVNAGSATSYCVNEVIECIVSSDCDDGNPSTVDRCEDPGSVESSCVYDDVICVEDVDCGFNGFVNGLQCGGDNVLQEYRTYECKDGGTISARCDVTAELRIVDQCSDTCSAGSCVTITCDQDSDCDDGNPGSNGICVNPGTEQSTCTYEDVLCQQDSNCGTDRYTGQLFCEGKSIFRNFVGFSCNDASTSGSFCSNSIEAVEVFECTYACNDGSCVRCNNIDDCDDNNPNTIDICRSSGLDSFCSHDVVSCFNDDGCGVDSLVGAPFCIGDDIYQNYRDLFCTNPGTGGSFCDASTDPQFVASCEFGCSGGVCEDERECANGEDDDGDDLIDAEDPGCWDDPLRPETYDPDADFEESDFDIECSDDFECGFDIVLFPPVCEGNEVIGRSIAPVCLLPGTGLSECAEHTVTEILDTCVSGEVCLVDQCVTDCYDNDDDGYDTCGAGEPDGDDEDDVDCNDNDASINPGATEICNLVDDNCDGDIDIADNICGSGPGDICQLGICANIACYDDGDCGAVQGGENYCDGNEVVFDQTVPVCLNPGTTSSECSDDNTIQILVQECIADEVCLEAQCVNDCVDDDGDGFDDCSGGLDDDGEDIDCNDGEMTINPGATEICDGIDNNCDGNVDENGDDSCGGGSICLLGSCVSECVDLDQDTYDACSPGEDGDDGKDLDCNDLDSSVNPGEEEVCDGIDNNCDGLVDEGNSVDLCGADMICEGGQCFNVACSSASDCGTDGPEGDDYCMENVVFRNIKTYVCNNPGTPVSSCSSFTQPMEVQQCVPDDVCSGGQCLTVACRNPSDCGTDGFVSENYCSGNSVVRNRETFTCNNAGTASSVCGSSTSAVEIEACGADNTCEVNQCVPICIPRPSIRNFAHSEDRFFLQDSGELVFDANNRCFERFYVAANGQTYCAGLALKFHDGGASANRLCNMAGYSSATITDSGTWHSPSDNTIAYYDNGVWRTKDGNAGGNRHINSIQCTGPLSACL